MTARLHNVRGRGVGEKGHAGTSQINELWPCTVQSKVYEAGNPLSQSVLGIIGFQLRSAALSCVHRGMREKCICGGRFVILPLFWRFQALQKHTCARFWDLALGQPVDAIENALPKKWEPPYMYGSRDIGFQSFDAINN